MKSILSFCAIFIQLCVLAQSSQSKKTIFQLLNVKGNCPVTRLEVEQYATVMEAPYWPTNNAPSLPANYVTEFNKVSKFEKLYAKTPATSVKFRNGNVVFKEQNLYGIKSSSGVVLIKPQFDHIFPDTTNAFIGYKNAFCNYYDATGKKKFKEDYYYIEKTKVNSFIVQNDKGYGVISANGVYLVKPAFYHIAQNLFTNLFTYKISINEDQGFTLLENLKDTIWAMPYSNVQKIYNEHWLVDHQIFNIKKNTKLFCDPGFYTEAVSVKHKLFLVSNGTDKKYLIDFMGNLIKEESFAAAWADRNNDDRFIAAIAKKERYQPYYGIIDSKGNWLISPSYQLIDPIEKDMYIAQLNGSAGIITGRNKEILPFQYNKINRVGHGLVYAHLNPKGKDEWQLIRISDKKVIQSGLKYTSISVFDMNGKRYYIAGTNEGELWLDENFKPLLPKTYTRVFPQPETNTVEGYDSKNNQPETQKFTAKGELITFNISGTDHTSYRHYLKPDSLFSYIYFNEEGGYYVLPDHTIKQESNYWYRIHSAGHKDFYIAASPDNKYGLINSEGEIIVSPIFEHIGPFDPVTGLAPFNFADKKRGFITREGKFLFNNEYDEIHPIGFGLFRVKKDERFGIVDRNQNIIIPIAYSSLRLYGGLFYTPSGRHTIRGELIN